MTRKDYIVLARVVREAYNDAPNEESQYGVSLLTGRLIRALEEDNPAFNRLQFLDAAFPDDRPRYGAAMIANEYRK